MIASADDEEFFQVSPDGALAISVRNDVDGEKLIGFHGFEWQVQVSSLSEEQGKETAAALDDFVKNILDDRSIIAVLRKHGEIVDVWVTDDPESDREFLQPGEELAFRNWSGAKLDV